MDLFSFFSMWDRKIAGSFLFANLIEYSIEKLGNRIERGKNFADSLQGQVIAILDNSLEELCYNNKWEYDSSAVVTEFLKNRNEIIQRKSCWHTEDKDRFDISQSELGNILEKCIGAKVEEDILQEWFFLVKKNLSKPEFIWLYNYIKLADFSEFTIGERDGISNGLNHKKEFQKKWNEVLFLHIGEKDKKRLCDLYSTPEFGKGNVKDIKYTKIKLFEKKGNIVLGYPGSGKTSFCRFMANLYAEDDRVVILKLKLIKEEFYESPINFYCYLKENISLTDKTIIFDGLDEVEVKDNITEFLAELVNRLSDHNICYIFTCRINYIDFNRHYSIFENLNIVTLLPLNEDKIREFYRKFYQNEIVRKIKKEDIGILSNPLILYIVCSLDIDLEKCENRFSLYNQLFSITDGLYEKCRFKGNKYDDIGRKYTVKEKEELDQIAKEISALMFRSGKTLIKKRNCEKMIEIKFPDRILDYGIANFYDISTKIEFIHQSFYEYYASEYLVSYLYEDILESKNDKEIQEKLAVLFKEGRITELIEEFMVCRMRLLDANRVKQLWNKMNVVFEKMINLGMTYYIQCEDVLKCEATVFSNMIKINNILGTAINCREKVMVSNHKNLGKYITLALAFRFNIKILFINLAGADFTRSPDVGLTVSQYASENCMSKLNTQEVNFYDIIRKKECNYNELYRNIHYDEKFK